MMLILLAALAAGAVPPSPVPAPPPPPAAVAPPASVPSPAEVAAITELRAKVDVAMAPYKGKPLAGLSSRLGPIESERPASDGRVVYWRIRSEGGTDCRVNAAGAFVCERAWPKECMLAVAVDVNSNITLWKLTGEAAACQMFLKALQAQP